MSTKARERIAFGMASALLLIGYAVLWLVGQPISRALWYLGWVVLAVAIVVLALPLYVLPRRGKAGRGKGVTDTTVVVESGLYGVIRHPLYLGWMLAYVALVLFAQHWLEIIVAVVGIASVYVISVQEERGMLARFGDEYARYMRTVPRLNLLAGIVRLLRGHRKE